VRSAVTEVLDRHGVVNRIRTRPGPRQGFGNIRDAIRSESRGITMNQRANGTTPKNAQVIDNRSVVNQAVGMISVQLAVPMPVAMKRLQDYAAEHGRTLGDVASDIVARRLQFDVDGVD
jgi:hypothetical protein